jgi:LEA14-like dessication related protein
MGLGVSLKLPSGLKRRAPRRYSVASQTDSRFYAVFVAGALLMAALFAYGYAVTQRGEHFGPKYIFADISLVSSSVQVTGLRTSGISINLAAVVRNPNPIGATIARLNYTVFANGEYVGNGSETGKIVVGPGATLSLDFPVMAPWNAVYGMTEHYFLSGGNIVWLVHGEASVSVGGQSFFASFQLTFS